MSTHTYEAIQAGPLHVGVWTPVNSEAVLEGASVPTVLAVHGVTATHQAWRFLPEQLPGVRIIAPDLRGRGRSNRLPGPYGMPRHAEDLAEVLAELGTGPVPVVAHSMGAFASVVFAHRHPELVSSMVLVDGGIPLDVPADIDPEVLTKAVLGPAAERLSMTFPDRESYQAFWRAHPAFLDPWPDGLAEYFDYDLDATEGGLRASCSIEALTGDQRELVSGESLVPALMAYATPTVFLRAPRGLLNGAPLYEPAYLAQWVENMPTVTARDIPDVNHYTIVMSPVGAAAVAGALAEAQAAAR